MHAGLASLTLPHKQVQPPQSLSCILVKAGEGEATACPSGHPLPL